MNFKPALLTGFWPKIKKRDAFMNFGESARGLKFWKIDPPCLKIRHHRIIGTTLNFSNGFGIPPRARSWRKSLSQLNWLRNRKT